ncbi:MAG: LuxR C-terminal-related transcriptional regulator, partial [Acetatifactor sp.]|nr:LuxR C-terminal-related transcriptional regulator [Acetatifactor sp.]
SCDMTNREIGKMLYISDTTVKKHITHILEKTGMADREELTKRIRIL